MIESRHNPLLIRLSNWYSKSLLDRHFSRIVYDDVLIEDKSLLLICNHISWWDGIFIYHLNNVLFGKKFHVMMLEEQLRPRILFRYLGAFSVRKGSRDVLASLDYCINILKNKNNMLLMFPQGEIESIYKTEHAFEKGISRLLKQPGMETQVLLCAVFIDYDSQKKPMVSFYFKTARPGDLADLKSLQRSYNDHYLESMNKQIIMIDKTNR